jgi:hypothetical protein
MQGEKPFEIFRKADYRDYSEHDVMPIVDMTPAIVEGLTAFSRAQGDGGSGQQVQMVYSRPGMSLTHVWFKSGYPLPLHAHASDCVYFILAGSVRMGDEQLGPGDGFFVGSDVPYTYETGPEGVEVLEFRTTDDFNIRFLAKNQTAWDKAAAKIEARRDDWRSELPPSETPKEKVGR